MGSAFRQTRSADTGTWQRPCSCGGTCSKCAGDLARGHRGALEPVRAVLSSPGTQLDPSVRTRMGAAFGHDFSRVRVHADPHAAASAHAVGSAAYAVGHHVAFAAGRYEPATARGQHLLAHELAHVVQQEGTGSISPTVPLASPASPAEDEAARAAADVSAGRAATGVRTAAGPSVARFSDTGHHVIEEVALSGAGFSEQQIEGIERGNIQRDYSQVGVVGNTLLLCKPQKFGGYRPEEHFDNYVWDAVTRGWRARGASALAAQQRGTLRTPIDYIDSQLDEVASRGLSDDAGLVRLGNAFHTIEDFFSHSNFVELMQGDTRHGTELITGDPAGPSQSVPRILESITPPGIQEHYRSQSEAAIAAAAPGSHTVMAHDDPTTTNYTVARRLAALVIQELGREVLAVMAAPPPQRARLMRERVGARVARYLRPPDPNDPWWQTLTTADAGRIDRRLDEAARRTPVTVNQCALSPLKNIEASRHSPMALPIGVALPTIIHGNQVWFQVGAGVNRPFPFEPLPGAPRAGSEGGSLVVGAQITGTF